MNTSHANLPKVIEIGLICLFFAHIYRQHQKKTDALPRNLALFLPLIQGLSVLPSLFSTSQHDPTNFLLILLAFSLTITANEQPQAANKPSGSESEQTGLYELSAANLRTKQHSPTTSETEGVAATRNRSRDKANTHGESEERIAVGG